jgi:Bacterial sugar transferase
VIDPSTNEGFFRLCSDPVPHTACASLEAVGGISRSPAAIRGNTASQPKNVCPAPGTAKPSVPHFPPSEELPDLINVLNGDMSLVRPRPLLMRYLDRYTPEQMRRHETLPGITGLEQVSGRNNLSWEKKFALDLWYVDHRSLWLEIKVLAMTVRAVLG